MTQWQLSNFNRFILDTEDDADSPINEELMQQHRENFEALILLLFATSITGTASATPTSPATEDTLTDSGKSWSVDQHQDRTLLITSGTAKGLFYTISSNTDRTLVCAGDDLEADGVVSGDTYAILYDIKANTDGHDHDGINSKKVTSVADGAIDTAQLASGAVTSAKIENGTIASADLAYNAGEVRQQGAGTANSYYEVLGADGSWRQCCGEFNDSDHMPKNWESPSSVKTGVI